MLVDIVTKAPKYDWMPKDNKKNLQIISMNLISMKIIDNHIYGKIRR